MKMTRLLTLLLAILLTGAVLGGCSVTPPLQPNKAPAVYEIFVGGFCDSNGDRMGDLNGITQKLDTIRELGVDTLWLMPIMPSPSYHKYDVTDYCAIDPAYGTMEDFDALITAATQRGMRVLLDLVVNHTGSGHPWFVDAKQNPNSPTRGYYSFSEAPQSGYAKVDDKTYYEARFTDTMPDLNLDSPQVRDELKGIMDFWLTKGVAGFRLDAVTSYYTGNAAKNTEFLHWLTDTAKAIRPDAYLVGEAWTTDPEILGYYKSGIDSLFGFNFAGTQGRIVKAINGKNGADFTAYLADYNAALRQANPAGRDATFLSNHDMARSAGFLQYKPEKQRLAAAIYQLMPGVSYLYYGEELGMNGSGNDPNKRLPFPWADSGVGGCAPPVGSDQQNNAPSLEAQQADSGSLYHAYKAILSVRKAHSQFYDGTVTPLAPDCRELIAYTLQNADGTLAVVHNLSDQPQSLPMGDGYRLDRALNGTATLKSGQLELAAFASAVLAVDGDNL
ncbi:MAG: alpha-amylase family glycosyl hydrolase [Angelakisella sp.]